MTSSRDEVVEGFIEALVEDDAELLYDRAPCGYLSTTPDGTIVKVNQTFAALCGYGREALVGRMRFAELLSPGGAIYYETHYAPMLRMHGAAREIALELVRDDGSRLPVLVNSVLEHDADGAPKVIRTAVFDATQRRSYERELLREKQRAEASEARATALARTLQQTLIPPSPPTVPHLDIGAHYRPSGSGDEVGGDFYDIFQTGVGDWVIVIGDVRGKGVEAAVVTALARYTLRAAAVANPSPAHALTVLNEALRREGVDRFCTVASVRLRQLDGSWLAIVCSAGHPLPLQRRAGSVSAAGVPGTLLGVLDTPELTDTPVTMAPGDTLLLYTDGVPDGRRGREFYGDERIVGVLTSRHESADDLATALLDDVLEFQHGSARDDIAIVAIRVPD